MWDMNSNAVPEWSLIPGFEHKTTTKPHKWLGWLFMPHRQQQMFATITDYFIISVVSDPVLQLSIAKKKKKKKRRRRRRKKRSFLSIYFKFQGDPMLGLDAVFCSHNVSSPSENFWHGIPMSALLWVSISLVEQKLGESPPYVSSKAICRSLMVCSRICSVFCWM